MKVKKIDIIKNVNGEAFVNLIITDHNIEYLEKLAMDSKNGKQLALDIKRIYKNRSVDANAYAWTIIDKIAKAIHSDKESVYKDMITTVGAFTWIPVKDKPEIIKRTIEIWQSNGLGWIAFERNKCKKLKGYVNIQCYYGSSAYDKKEMANLIDYIVEVAKDLGIDTSTPQETQRLINLWQNTQNA